VSAVSSRRLRAWSLGALFWLGLGLFFGSQGPFASVVLGRNASEWREVLASWVVHWLAWGLFFVPVSRLARRFPLAPFSWRHLAVHLVAGPIVSTLQLAVMELGSYPIHAGTLDAAGYSRDLVSELGIHSHLNLLTYWVILGAVVTFDAFQRSRAEQLRASRLAELLAQAELAALRMQLHPHFLFNSLHTAAELVHENPNAAEKSLLGLADLLRRALHAGERGETTLAEELEFVDGYLDLERARLEGRLAVSYRVPEELLAARLPSLLLQPLVENAIRHGIAQRPQGGEIVLAAERLAGDRLRIDVDNDTAERPRLIAGSGIGLANVRARLGHLYGERGVLSVETAAPLRYRVRLELPLELAATPSSRSYPATATAAAGVPT
jgi:hypothetical protein